MMTLQPRQQFCLLAATLSTGLLSTGILFDFNTATHAQTCNYYTGKAVGGQAINIDLCSISRTNNRAVDFVYYLGRERVQSQANCQARTWTSFPERAVNRPQSKATQDMLKIVCTAPRAMNDAIAIGVVFDPPSNVRTSPNGSILCTIRDVTAIEVFGGVTNDGWSRTSACGKTGVIHQSQVRFR